MTEERRMIDIQVEMIIDKIDGLEKKMDLFVADFKHQCEQKHFVLDKYIREATDKVPIGNCNERMAVTERIVSRHTVYWGILIVSVPVILTIFGWIIEKLFVR